MTELMTALEADKVSNGDMSFLVLPRIANLIRTQAVECGQGRQTERQIVVMDMGSDPNLVRFNRPRVYSYTVSKWVMHDPMASTEHTIENELIKSGYTVNRQLEPFPAMIIRW